MPDERAETQGMRMLAALVLTLGLSACSCIACAEVDDGTLPPGGEPFTPPAHYMTLWREVERCSGFSGDFSSVRWLLYRNVDHIPRTRFTVARTLIPERVVGLVEASARADRDVRHEMLRLLSGDPRHPDEPYRKCGSSLIADWGQWS